MPGGLARLLTGVVRGGRAAKRLPSSVKQMAVGAGLGAGAGEVQNRLWSEDWHPTTKAETIIGSAGVGALLGHPRIRAALSTKLKPAEKLNMSKVPIGDPISSKLIRTPRWTFPFTASALFSSAGLLPRVTEGSTRLAEGIGPAIESPKFGRVVHEIAEDPAQAVKNLLEPSMRRGKQLAGEAAGEAGQRVVSEMKPQLSDFARHLGLSLGGGVAGYYGGGALGRLIGRLVSPDKPKAEYEERQKQRDRRALAEMIGSILGAYSMSLGSPLLYRKLTNK